MEICRHAVEHPSAWTGTQMRRTSDWTVQWPANARDELEAALEHLVRNNKSAPHFDKADFPLPTLAPFIENVMREVTDGRGFVLLRGLPVDRTRLQEVYWGLGCHWGRPI